MGPCANKGSPRNRSRNRMKRFMGGILRRNQDGKQGIFFTCPHGSVLQYAAPSHYLGIDHKSGGTAHVPALSLEFANPPDQVRICRELSPGAIPRAVPPAFWLEASSGDTRAPSGFGSFRIA